MADLRERGVVADLADLLVVAATETVTEDDIDRLETGLREIVR